MWQSHLIFQPQRGWFSHNTSQLFFRFTLMECSVDMHHLQLLLRVWMPMIRQRDRLDLVENIQMLIGQMETMLPLKLMTFSSGTTCYSAIQKFSSYTTHTNSNVDCWHGLHRDIETLWFSIKSCHMMAALILSDLIKDMTFAEWTVLISGTIQYNFYFIKSYMGCALF